MNAKETLEQFAFSNLTDCSSEVFNSIIEIGKLMDIKHEDITAIFTEIGVNVNEEIGYKIRAILGRWVKNAEYENVLCFLIGYMKVSALENDTKRIDDGLCIADTESNISIACAIAFAWCMLIETGVATEKGLKDNKSYMPETLKPMIAIDGLSRLEIVKRTENHRRYTIFKALVEIFINNINRYCIANTQPHESDHAYLSITKECFKRVGGNPAMFAYRCVDDGIQNWNLFYFLTMN